MKLGLGECKKTVGGSLRTSRAASQRLNYELSTRDVQGPNPTDFSKVCSQQLSLDYLLV